MIAVALALIGLGALLLFLFPWGGILLGLVGIALLVLTIAGWIARPTNRHRA